MAWLWLNVMIYIEFHFFCVQKQRSSIDVLIFFYRNVNIILAVPYTSISLYTGILKNFLHNHFSILVSLDPFHFYHPIYLFVSGYVSHTIHLHDCIVFQILTFSYYRRRIFFFHILNIERKNYR